MHRGGHRSRAKHRGDAPLTTNATTTGGSCGRLPLLFLVCPLPLALLPPPLPPPLLPLTNPLLALRDGALGKVRDYRRRQLLRALASPLTQPHQIRHRAAVHQRALVIDALAQVPDRPRGVLLRALGAFLADETQQRRHRAAFDDGILHLDIAKRKLPQRRRRLLRCLKLRR